MIYNQQPHWEALHNNQQIQLVLVGRKSKLGKAVRNKNVRMNGAHF